MDNDIALKNISQPFSKISRGNDGRKKYCPLCSKAGIESEVNDEDICKFCGDVGVSYGISKDDDLFVVNSVGGADSSDTGESRLAFGTFGGFESLDQTKPAPTHKSLQQALKETEMS